MSILIKIKPFEEWYAIHNSVKVTIDDTQVDYLYYIILDTIYFIFYKKIEK